MRKPKFMLIGLDSLSISNFDAFKECCPTIQRLMARGVSGSAMPSFPIYTPTNWAALSTGAIPAVTGAAGWFNDHAGEFLSTFDRRAIKCDTVFDSAARAGLKTLAITYPSAHPARSSNNLVIAPLDRGLVSNCLVPGKVVDVDYDADGVFEFTLVEPFKAVSGAALAKAVGATEDGAKLSGKARKVAAKSITAYLLRRPKSSWKLGFTGDPKAARLSLRHEVWSEPIPVRLTTPGRPGKCVIRVMVFDGGKRLAVSEAYDIGALGKPAKLARDVYNRLGPPTEHSAFYRKLTQLFRQDAEDKTITRLARADLTAQADWIAAAAAMVQKTNPYDVFYLHHHYPDSVLHLYLAAAEGSPAFTRRQHRLAREAMRMCLEILDGLVARLLRLAGPKTTVLLVSDHGNVPNRYAANIRLRLVKTGLTVLKKDGAVNHTRSLAWTAQEGAKAAKGPNAKPGTWIDVNAREGTAEYEKIQAKVLDALLDWKTPSGERVIALALRKKDSHLLGYGGSECGDVTFHYNSGFAWFGGRDKVLVEDRRGSNHGPQMPVTYSKLSDNMAFFVLAGPAVRRGVRWDGRTGGHVNLIDMVPTLCHLSGVPAPRHVAGAVRYDLLR